jgi:putative copper resistance protein D
LDQALVICRLLHFAAAFLLFGMSTFFWIVAPSDVARRLEKQLGPVIFLSLFIMGFTAIGLLLLTAGAMGEGWRDALNLSVLQDVLLDTEFGKVWQFRFISICLLIAVMALPGHHLWRNMTVAAALALGTLGFVGHAAIEGGIAGFGHELNHAVHLLSAGFWFGALVPVALLLGDGSRNNLNSTSQTALDRFSGAGHFAVAMVLATGAINTWLIVGGWPNNPRSPYQTLLRAKIILVGAMIGLAVINRYLLVPLTRRGSWPVKLLLLNTIGEISLGSVVIVLVSYFAMLEPE